MSSEVVARNFDQTYNDQSENNTQLTLWFTSDTKLELIKTCFRSPLLQQEITAVRGKTAGAYATNATFQWTSAVQALSVLLLRAASCSKSNRLGATTREPLLEGGKGSLAASLDASLYKQTAWLSDIFGSNVNGDAISKRILPRSNPGRRRTGPVMISLNENLLPYRAINVYLNNRPVNDPSVLRNCIDRIENEWNKAIECQMELIIPASPNPYQQLWQK